MRRGERAQQMNLLCEIHTELSFYFAEILNRLMATI